MWVSCEVKREKPRESFESLEKQQQQFLICSEEFKVLGGFESFKSIMEINCLTGKSDGRKFSDLAWEYRHGELTKRVFQWESSSNAWIWFSVTIYTWSFFVSIDTSKIQLEKRFIQLIKSWSFRAHVLVSLTQASRNKGVKLT